MLDKKAEATPRIFNALGNAPQAGNSNSDERMDLLDRFYKIFPNAEIAYLTGDREFVGKQWFTYLLIEPTIPFRLRIRHSDRIFDGRKELRASIVFANLKRASDENFIWSKMGLGSSCLCFRFTVRRW